MFNFCSAVINNKHVLLSLSSCQLVSNLPAEFWKSDVFAIAVGRGLFKPRWSETTFSSRSRSTNRQKCTIFSQLTKKQLILVSKGDLALFSCLFPVWKKNRILGAGSALVIVLTHVPFCCLFSFTSSQSVLFQIEMHCMIEHAKWKNVSLTGQHFASPWHVRSLQLLDVKINRRVVLCLQPSQQPCSAAFYSRWIWCMFK